jgi:hypothetical protein
VTSSLERAHAAFAARAWRVAADAYAETGAPLRPDNHARRAAAAFLVGDDGTCERAWEDAYRRAVKAGDRPTAARYAWWLAFCLLLRGQMAQASGWLTRTRRLLRAAGLVDVTATTSTATLRLGPPAEFLWQYINLTPMGSFVAEAPATAQEAMERDAVESWQPFVVDETMAIDLSMVVASGRTRS